MNLFGAVVGAQCRVGLRWFWPVGAALQLRASHVVAPLAAERRPWVRRLLWLRLMSSGAVRPGARARTQYLWLTGLVVPRRVGSSWVRDQTRVSCIGRQFLYH